MREEKILELFEKFESIVSVCDGVECWSAREMCKLLGYAKWEKFCNVIDKAKDACANAGETVDNHFPHVGKMVSLGSGSEREIDDYLLTRYACYLIAQNGDPRKPQIAFAQNYFAVQTRRAEVITQRLKEYERVVARAKLKETEKQLSDVVYERGIDDSKDFAALRSKGDYALFRLTTEQAKIRFKAPKNRPLADFLPTIDIKAKDFAAAMTSTNVKAKDIRGQRNIEDEHITNNREVRSLMIKRGIVPEEQEPAEDIKHVERRIASEARKLLGSNDRKKTE